LRIGTSVPNLDNFWGAIFDFHISTTKFRYNGVRLISRKHFIDVMCKGANVINCSAQRFFTQVSRSGINENDCAPHFYLFLKAYHSTIVSDSPLNVTAHNYTQNFRELAERIFLDEMDASDL
jgi:hypothetical protein